MENILMSRELIGKLLKEIRGKFPKKSFGYFLAKQDEDFPCTIETRYIVNKICCEENKFLVDGGIENFSGYVWTIYPGKTACYNCVFPENRMSFEKHTIGVIGALPGIIGSLQAMESLKYIIGKATICNKIL